MFASLFVYMYVSLLVCLSVSHSLIGFVFLVVSLFFYLAFLSVCCLLSVCIYVFISGFFPSVFLSFSVCQSVFLRSFMVTGQIRAQVVKILNLFVLSLFFYAYISLCVMSAFFSLIFSLTFWMPFRLTFCLTSYLVCLSVWVVDPFYLPGNFL